MNVERLDNITVTTLKLIVRCNYRYISSTRVFETLLLYNNHNNNNNTNPLRPNS